MGKSSSREGVWSGGGRTSSIKRGMEAGNPDLSGERTSGLDWLEHGGRDGGREVRNMDLLATSAGYGPKGKSFERRNQNVRTSGF